MDAFWEDEKDLSDEEQKRFEPNTDFEADNPDGAAKSIESASQLEFSDPLEQTLQDRAEAIQTIDNDPDIPDQFEDDVYESEQRAYQAVKGVFQRGLGAAQGSRGVESPVQWGFARVDEFGGIVKEGQPDDSDYKSDNDLLPNGHPRASRDGEEPFVEGVPDEDMRMEIEKKYL